MFFWETVRMKMECDLLLYAFMLVLAVALLPFATERRSKISPGLVTYVSVAPATVYFAGSG